MKKLFYPLVLLGSLILVPSAASAAPYVSANIGIASPSNVVTDVFSYDGFSMHRTVETPLDSGVILLGAVGYDFGNCRIEGEVGYQKTSSSGLSLQTYNGIQHDEYHLTGDGSVLSFLVNTYYDIHVNHIKPYITGGLGVARFSIEDVGGDIIDPSDGISAQTATALVYQVGCGVEIPISNTISMDARYRHFATKNFNLLFSPDLVEDNINANNIHFSSNSLLIGLNVKI